MSRPRAATSVATRTRISPALNASSAFVRSDCARSEWIAVAATPCRSSHDAEPRGRDLRPGEDEHLVPVALDDQVGEQLLLAVAVDRVDELADALGGGAVARDLDRDRVAQDRARKALDLVRERGREQQRLLARRQEVEDPLDVGHEAHVEHPVRLVEDEDLDLAEVGGSLADEVEQAPGRGDEDLDPRAQLLDLGVQRDAAVHDRRSQRDVPAVGLHALGDLDGELARRRQDQAADRMAGRRERGVRLGPEPVEDGEGEGRRLAGTGLCSGEDVLALEHQRDRPLLDRCRLGVALLGDCPQHFAGQAQLVKAQGCS